MTDTARHDTAIFRFGLKALSDDQLFEAWSREYDDKQQERAALVIAEMNTRHLSTEAIRL
jgi:hypothetical protein